MIVTKCPLRISLAGGSTDLQHYLDIYEKGKVLSFTPNLFAYIILKKSSSRYYRIIYSKIENILHPEEIQSDIAREVLLHFEMPPVEVIFTADIPSTGSGLASSSAYLIALVKACLEFKKLSLTKEEIGKLAIELERKFNPLVGYQDVYGCLYPGLKELNFNKEGLESVRTLSSILFDKYAFKLVPTGIVRSSTNVINALDFEEVHKLTTVADDMIEALQKEKYERVIALINKGWQQKKQTASVIVNDKIKALEKKISSTEGVLAWRLIGAGNGGYFLVVCEKFPIKLFDCLEITLYKE